MNQIDTLCNASSVNDLNQIEQYNKLTTQNSFELPQRAIERNNSLNNKYI